MNLRLLVLLFCLCNVSCSFEKHKANSNDNLTSVIKLINENWKKNNSKKIFDELKMTKKVELEDDLIINSFYDRGFDVLTIGTDKMNNLQWVNLYPESFADFKGIDYLKNLLKSEWIEKDVPEKNSHVIYGHVQVIIPEFNLTFRYSKYDKSKMVKALYWRRDLSKFEFSF